MISILAGGFFASTDPVTPIGPMAATRIFLVDDEPVVRTGLRQVLEAFELFSIAGKAGFEEEGRPPPLQVDFAVVDISMGGMDGIEFTRRLKQCASESRRRLLDHLDTGKTLCCSARQSI